MILGIDTVGDHHRVYLTDRGRVQEYCWQRVKGGSQELLSKIDQLLKTHGVQLKQLRAIVINRGPGSFTGIRIGIAVANALAWSLSIPVEEQDMKKAHLEDPKGGFDGPVLPVYSS